MRIRDYINAIINAGFGHFVSTTDRLRSQDNPDYVPDVWWTDEGKKKCRELVGHTWRCVANNDLIWLYWPDSPNSTDRGWSYVEPAAMGRDQLDSLMRATLVQLGLSPEDDMAGTDPEDIVF